MRDPMAVFLKNVFGSVVERGFKRRSLETKRNL